MDVFRKGGAAAIFTLALAMAGGAAGAPAESFAAWKAQLLKQERALGRNPAALKAILAGVEPDPDVLEKSRRFVGFKQPLNDYLEQRVTPDMLARGRAASQRYAKTLEAIEGKYHVDRAVVVAVWGMETRFGDAPLAYDAARSITTLAYGGGRKYFTRQLRTLADLVAAKRLARDQLKSSWDGGLGQPQFMPDIFASSAVDGDGDGVIDIWNSTPDALASIANHLRELGWRQGAPAVVAVQLSRPLANAEQNGEMTIEEWAKLGVSAPGGAPQWDQRPIDRATLYQPFGADGPKWLRFDNFRVLMRYNGASIYGLAASLFAQGLAGDKPIQPASWPAPGDELRGGDVLELQQSLLALGFDPGRTDGLYGGGTWKAMNLYLDKRGQPARMYPTKEVLDAVRAEIKARPAPH